MGIKQVSVSAFNLLRELDMRLKTVFLVLFLLLLASSALAADQISLCNGVYQNRPCRPGQQGGPVRLPQVDYVGGLTIPRNQTQRPETSGYARGQLAMPEAVPRVPLDKSRLHSLSQKATYLRMNAESMIRERGTDRTMHEIEKLIGQIDPICRQEQIIRDSDARADCETAQQDLMAAQRSVRTY